MLSAFIQQHAGQAPPGNAAQDPAPLANGNAAPAPTNVVPVETTAPAGNGNGGQGAPAAGNGNGGQGAPAAGNGNGGQGAPAAGNGNGGQGAAAAANGNAGQGEAVPVMDAPRSPVPRTPDPPVRPRSRPVDELLRTAASKSMAKARPPVPRNLFNTPESGAPAQPALTLTPGLGDGATSGSGLDGSPVEEERHGHVEGGTQRSQEHDARPFCAICQDVMDHHQEALQALPCGHCFHVECFQRWRHDSCPICRQHMMMDPWRTPGENNEHPDEEEEEVEVPEPVAPANADDDDLGFL